MKIAVELSPGDFLDRFAVLTVKHKRFGEEQRAKITPEFQRYATAATEKGILRYKGVSDLFIAMLKLHDDTFLMMERAVPAALEGQIGLDDHVAAIRLNKERVRLRQAVDAIFGTDTEVKSYYGSKP